MTRSRKRNPVQRRRDEIMTRSQDTKRSSIQRIMTRSRAETNNKNPEVEVQSSISPTALEDEISVRATSTAKRRMAIERREKRAETNNKIREVEVQSSISPTAPEDEISVPATSTAKKRMGIERMYRTPPKRPRTTSPTRPKTSYYRADESKDSNKNNERDSGGYSSDANIAACCVLPHPADTRRVERETQEVGKNVYRNTRNFGEKRQVGHIVPKREKVKAVKSHPGKEASGSDDEADNCDSEDESSNKVDDNISTAETESDYYLERIGVYENHIKESSTLYTCPCCGEEKKKSHFKVTTFLALGTVANTTGIQHTLPDGSTLLPYVQLATNSTPRFGSSAVCVNAKYVKKLHIYLRTDVATGEEVLSAVCNYWFVPYLPITESSIRLCSYCNGFFNRAKLPTWNWKDFPIQKTPTALSNLSPLEGSLLCKVLPVVKVVKVYVNKKATGQGFTSKQVCNFRVSNSEIVNKIPRRVEDVMLEVIFHEGEFDAARTEGGGGGATIKSNSSYQVRKKELLEGAEYLFANNIWYTNKAEELDIAALKSLHEQPINQTADLVDERIMMDEEGENPDEEDVPVLETIRQALEATSEDGKIHIPRSNSFVDWKNTPNLVELCFPLLYPDGRGGLYNYNMEKQGDAGNNNDDTGEDAAPVVKKTTVTYSGYFRHTLLFYTRQFQRSKTYIAWWRSEMVKRSILGICATAETFQQARKAANADMPDDVDRSLPSTGSSAPTMTNVPIHNNIDSNILTADKLKNLSHANQSVLKMLKPFYNTYALKGTKINMEEHRRDVFTMLASGNMPVSVSTFFITLSSGDLNWPSFYHMVDPTLVSREGVWSREVTLEERKILLSENPVLACEHFMDRFVSYLETIVKCKSPFNTFGDVVDEWFRIEFQARGSIHAHGFLWSKTFKDAVTLLESMLEEDKATLVARLKHVTHAQADFPKMQGNADMTPNTPTDEPFEGHKFYESAATKFLDPNVTQVRCAKCIAKKYCIHYDEDDPRWQSVYIHPNSRFALKESIKSPAMLYDMLELIQANQWHICKPSCFKYWDHSKSSNPNWKEGDDPKCRHNFDKALHEGDFEIIVVVEQDEIGRPKFTFEVLHKRETAEDAKINPYHHLTMLTWRGNHDVKYIANPYGCAIYTTKYASKAEKQDFLIIDEKMRVELERLLVDDKGFKVMRFLRKYLYNALGKREVGMQEACWIGLGYPLVMKSRKLEKVNTLPPELRRRKLKNPRQLKSLDDNSTDVFSEATHALLTAYMNRPRGGDHEVSPILPAVCEESNKATGRMDIGDSTANDGVAANLNDENCPAVHSLCSMDDTGTEDHYHHNHHLTFDDVAAPAPDVSTPVVGKGEDLDNYDSDCVDDDDHVKSRLDNGINWEKMCFDTFVTWFTIQQKDHGKKERYVCYNAETGKKQFITLNSKRTILRKWPYIAIDYTDKVSLYSIMMLYIPFRSENEIKVAGDPKTIFDSLRKSGRLARHVLETLERQALVDRTENERNVKPTKHNTNVPVDSDDDEDNEHYDADPNHYMYAQDDEFFTNDERAIDIEGTTANFNQADIFVGGMDIDDLAKTFIAKCTISARKAMKDKIGICHYVNPNTSVLSESSRLVNDKSFTLLKAKLKSLNLKQTHSMEAFLTDVERGNQIITCASGGAGVGKSFLIEAIELLAACLSTKARGLYAPAAKMSPSANAACLIGGGTIHSMIGIMRFSAKKIKDLFQLQMDWRDVLFLILDEMSMCDMLLLVQIDRRLRIIMSCNKPFGGLHVILCGDFYQLPPVNRDAALFIQFVKERSKNMKLKYEAIAIMQSIVRYIGLDEIMRTDNPLYGTALKLLRPGPPDELTQDECDAVSKAFATRLGQLPTTFAEALSLINTRYTDKDPDKLVNIVAAKWKVVDKYNEEWSTANQIKYGKITIYARHTYKAGGDKLFLGKDSRPLSLKLAEGLMKYQMTKSNDAASNGAPGILTLAKNDRVLITAKINQELGLVNGAKGTVFGFVYDKAYSTEALNVTLRQALIRPPPVPIVLVRLDNFDFKDNDDKPLRFTVDGVLLPEKVVPIEPVDYLINKFPCDEMNKATFVRRMVPLIQARCTTIHKCQGHTYTEAYGVHVEGMFESGMAYTSVSRARELEHLHLLKRKLELKDFKKNAAMLQHIRREYTRLEEIGIGETNVDINETVMELNDKGKLCPKDDYIDSYISRIRKYNQGPVEEEG